MSEQTSNTPGSANTIVPVTGALGQKSFEQVQIKGNRLDNQSEALAQHRQILSYRSRWSDTFSDAVLWMCASGTISRLLLLMSQFGIAPIYPIGIGLIVVIIGVTVSLDTVRRYPSLSSAFYLRCFYVLFGLLSTLM